MSTDSFDSVFLLAADLCSSARFDILNLLTALPSPPLGPPSPALSAGFSELGSDHEEMFFFDQQTQKEINNRKKRRRLEDGREERMRRLDEEEKAVKGEDEEGDEVRPSRVRERIGPDGIAWPMLRGNVYECLSALLLALLRFCSVTAAANATLLGLAPTCSPSAPSLQSMQPPHATPMSSFSCSPVLSLLCLAALPYPTSADDQARRHPRRLARP